MAKLKTIHRCNECGAVTPKWTGRCPACGGWNTLVEDVEMVGARASPSRASPRAAPAPITAIGGPAARPVPTGVTEFDRVLGGGLVPGSVTLLGGEPGAGKSTLLLDVAAHHAAAGRRALYVSAEEGVHQVRARAERLGTLDPELWLLAETALPDIIDACDTVHPSVVVIDSIQTVADPELGAAPGSVVQVRECAHQLVQQARVHGMAVVLVGHVTKDGTLAGPRVLEHVVDTVLAFEGDRHHALRLIRAVKHRFGSTSELGVFEMTGGGLAGVADPSGLFLADRRCGVAGSAVVPALDGHRPLLVEVQALVTASPLPAPRRSAQGIDPARLAMLLAVLQERAGWCFSSSDVYASAVGGIRLVEPGSDLALCLALASSRAGRPVPSSTVACGEVGLGGEVRHVGQTPRRLAEAARLGFRRALVPPSVSEAIDGLELVQVAHVGDALDAAGLGPDARPTKERPP
jgi:DNA repair protein RadA/Sms